MKKNLLFLTLLLNVSFLQAQITVGSELSPNDGALMDMKQYASSNKITSTKGLNFPRVALQDPYKLEPCATTTTANKYAHQGLIVYHTDASIMDEGIYYWNGANWIRMVTELPKSQLNLLNQTASSTSDAGTSTGSGGVTLNFPAITIPDDGSYAFNFRFYGEIADVVTEPQRCVYYLSAWADNGSTVTMVDIAEINIYAYISSPSRRYTYSVALGCTVNAGDKITFKLSHMGAFPWTLLGGGSNTAARTSMIWWKL